MKVYLQEYSRKIEYKKQKIGWEKKMKKRTMTTLAGIVAIAVIVTAVAAQLIGTFTTTHQLSIKGIGIDVLEWIDDTTTPTDLFSSYDWGSLEVDYTAYSVKLVLYGSGTEDSTLAFTDTLSSSIGVIRWEIEFYDSNWGWVDWQYYLDLGDRVGQDAGANDVYIYGSPENPLLSEQYVGLRPSSPVKGDFGRVRLTLTTDSDAPMGAAPDFDTVVTATEIV